MFTVFHNLVVSQDPVAIQVQTSMVDPKCVLALAESFRLLFKLPSVGVTWCKHAPQLAMLSQPELERQRQLFPRVFPMNRRDPLPPHMRLVFATPMEQVPFGDISNIV